MSERRIMLRFRILVSAIPLILAAAFARGGLLPGAGGGHRAQQAASL
jgi:hypothetical protein